MARPKASDAARKPRGETTLLQLVVPVEVKRAMRVYAFETESNMSELGAQMIIDGLRKLNRWPADQAAS
jgi:hypothetical protein